MRPCAGARIGQTGVFRVFPPRFHVRNDFAARAEEISQNAGHRGRAHRYRRAGIKYKSRTDLMMAVLDQGTAVAGVLTRSKTCSAPVLWCREGLQHGKARALVVNSGNANAFTGKKGKEATRITAEAAAEAVGCSPGEVFIASTGARIRLTPASSAIARRVTRTAGPTCGPKPQGDQPRTPYPVTATVKLGDTDVTINGIAKGAGMIAPDMATMLSFVATDAPIAAPVLQDLLSRGTAKTFNAVTVDSDTSTSDTVLIFATGTAARRGAPTISV
jgi:glutamate N-acetyltransferase/amino-acid N-acetyltransferase